MCIGKECVRFILFAINFVVFVAGICMISVGAVYLADLKDYQKVIPEEYNLGIAPILCIATGSIVALIAFFGCCGSCKQSYCLLTTYAAILIALFIIQIAIGVFGFMQVKDRNEFDNQVDKSLNKIFNHYNNDKASKELMDLIQKDLKCCGIRGPGDWGSNKPSSCGSATEGCKTKVADFLHSTVRIIAIVVLGLTATEVLGAVFALCLANSIRNGLRRGGYA